MSTKTDSSHLISLDIEDALAQFESIIEHFPGYVYWKDRESKYRGCNANLAKLAGLKDSSEIIGKADEDLPWHERSADYVRMDQEVMKTDVKSTSVNKLPLKRSDGNCIYIKTEQVALKNKDGDVKGVLGIAIDITDEQLTKEEAFTTHAFVEDIFYNLPGLIYWKNENSQYMGFNKNVVTLSGLSRDDLLGKTDKELNWGQTEAESFQQDDQEVMKTGQINITEYQIPVKRPDGNYYHIRTEKMPLYNNNNAIGVLAVAVDITDQKILEKKLEIANRALTLMTGSVIHELRTPLVTVKLATLTIAQYLPTLSSAYQSTGENELSVEKISSSEFFTLERCVENIKTEINAANMFIDMLLLNLAEPKIAAEKMKDCSIKQCVDIALERYPLTKQEKSKIFFKSSNDFIFRGDELLMTHIIFNLLKNSLYYINAAGKGEIHIWMELNDSMHKLYFKDTAKGISTDAMPHIFERFYTDTQGGSGIGLAFCKMTMELFGGDIHCQSVEGSYAEFVMSFPNSTTYAATAEITH